MVLTSLISQRLYRYHLLLLLIVHLEKGDQCYLLRMVRIQFYMVYIQQLFGSQMELLYHLHSLHLYYQ